MQGNPGGGAPSSNQGPSSSTPRQSIYRGVILEHKEKKEVKKKKKGKVAFESNEWEEPRYTETAYYTITTANRSSSTSAGRPVIYRISRTDETRLFKHHDQLKHRRAKFLLKHDARVTESRTDMDIVQVSSVEIIDKPSDPTPLTQNFNLVGLIGYDEHVYRLAHLHNGRLIDEGRSLPTSLIDQGGSLAKSYRIPPQIWKKNQNDLNIGDFVAFDLDLKDRVPVVKAMLPLPVKSPLTAQGLRSEYERLIKNWEEQQRGIQDVQKQRENEERQTRQLEEARKKAEKRRKREIEQARKKEEERRKAEIEEARQKEEERKREMEEARKEEEERKKRETEQARKKEEEQQKLQKQEAQRKAEERRTRQAQGMTQPVARNEGPIQAASSKRRNGVGGEEQPHTKQQRTRQFGYIQAPYPSAQQQQPMQGLIPPVPVQQPQMQQTFNPVVPSSEMLPKNNLWQHPNAYDGPPLPSQPWPRPPPRPQPQQQQPPSYGPQQLSYGQRQPQSSPWSQQQQSTHRPPPHFDQGYPVASQPNAYSNLSTSARPSTRSYGYAPESNVRNNGASTDWADLQQWQWSEWGQGSYYG